MSIYTTPPTWQQDAVPTPNGWKHPTRNELLVSVKLDMSLFEKKKDDVEVKEATPVVEVKEVVTPAPKQTKKKNEK